MRDFIKYEFRTTSDAVALYAQQRAGGRNRTTPHRVEGNGKTLIETMKYAVACDVFVLAVRAMLVCAGNFGLIHEGKKDDE